MTWGQMLRYFIEATGNTQAAALEGYDHLSEGYRRVCSSIDDPSVITETEVTVALGADEVTSVPADLDTILSAFNKTDVQEMFPEPDGMLGRNRYLQSDGKPPSGNVRFYFQDGAKIKVRDKASATTTVILRYRKEVATVTSADIAAVPILPERYHWPIVHASVVSYFNAHPRENAADPETSITLSRKAQSAYVDAMGATRQTYPDLNKAGRRGTRLAGYRIRRWR